MFRWLGLKDQGLRLHIGAFVPRSGFRSSGQFRCFGSMSRYRSLRTIEELEDVELGFRLSGAFRVRGFWGLGFRVYVYRSELSIRRARRSHFSSGALGCGVSGLWF